MNNLGTRVILAAVVMAILFGITYFMGLVSGVTKPVKMPETSIKTMPLVLGEWKGEEQELNNRLFRAMQATEAVSRVYKNGNADISASVATFGKFWPVLPHPPTVCYPSSGFTKSSEKVVTLPGCDGAQAKLMIFEKDKVPHLVLCWFQFGDRTCLENDDLSESQRALREKKEWPSIIKVLLDTSHPRPDQYEEEFLAFAGRVRNWTKDIQDGPPSPERAAEAAKTAPKGKESDRP